MYIYIYMYIYIICHYLSHRVTYQLVLWPHFGMPGYQKVEKLSHGPGRHQSLSSFVSFLGWGRVQGPGERRKGSETLVQLRNPEQPTPHCVQGSFFPNPQNPRNQSQQVVLKEMGIYNTHSLALVRPVELVETWMVH